MNEIYELVSRLQDAIYNLKGGDHFKAIAFIDKYLESVFNSVKMDAYRDALNQYARSKVEVEKEDVPVINCIRCGEEITKDQQQLTHHLMCPAINNKGSGLIAPFEAGEDILNK